MIFYHQHVVNNVVDVDDGDDDVVESLLDGVYVVVVDGGGDVDFVVCQQKKLSK